MEVRLGYKQTEVGVIPEDWDVKPLSDIVSTPITDGPHLTPAFLGDGVPFLSVNNLVDNKLDLNSLRFISREDHGEFSKKCKPRRGDILFGKAASVGQVALIDTDMELNIWSPLALIRVGQKATPLFVLFALQNRDVHRQIALLTNSSSQGNIGMSDIGRIAIPIPSVLEQRAIAEALSDVDALLGGLDRLIAKKRDLKQAALQQLLTGQTRLPGFGPTASFREYSFGWIPDDWEVKPLKSVSTMNGRIGWQGLKQEEFTLSPNDPFLITGMNFKDGKIRWDEVYHIPEERYLEAAPIQLRPDDVLMTKDGTIGKLLYVEYIPHPGRASLNSHLLVFRPIAGEYNPEFLFYQFGSPTFAQHIELHKSGTTFFGLSQTATGKYPTILPSVPEQTAIAAVLSDMDAELAALGARRDKTRDLKRAMMQGLLTGKTRLVPAGAAHA